jgi:putative DNA primase/helicase
VPLPDLRPNGDVSDYLDEGHTVEELAAVVDATPWLEAAPEPTAEPAAGPHIGDGGVTGAGESSAWPIPEPVSADLPPVPAFDVPQLVPKGLAPWIIDITERAQCPPDFVATAAIVALGSVVGRALTIRPKAHDDWTVVPASAARAS